MEKRISYNDGELCIDTNTGCMMAVGVTAHKAMDIFHGIERRQMDKVAKDTLLSDEQRQEAVTSAICWAFDRVNNCTLVLGVR